MLFSPARPRPASPPALPPRASPGGGQGAGARARPPQPRARLRFSVPLLGIPYGCPAASQITIKLPHFKASCCPLTSLSASPFPPRLFPLPHLHKWLPGPAGFSGGPSSRSLLQFSAPSSKDPSRVLIPQGSDLGRIPGSSPHHGVPPLPDSGESGNKPIWSLSFLLRAESTLQVSFFSCLLGPSDLEGI